MWKTVLEVAGQVGIFGIAAYFIQTIINTSASKKIEDYRSELDKNVREFQSTLELNINEHRTRLEILTFKYSKYHEKRLEVIEGVYSRLADLHFSMLQLTAVIKVVQKDFEAEDNIRIKNAADAYTEFRIYYSRLKIFINKDTCEKLDKLKVTYYNVLGDYSYTKYNPHTGLIAELSKNIQTDINHTIPGILSELDNEFRQIISVDEKAKIV